MPGGESGCATINSESVKIGKRMFFMLVELRGGRSQITIPAEIIKQLGAVEGDKFEVVVKEGMLIFVPVVVYPKKRGRALEETSQKKQKASCKNCRSMTMQRT